MYKKIPLLLVCLIALLPATAIARFPAVENLSAEYLDSKDKVKISWRKVSGADKYRVTVTDSSGASVKRLKSSKKTRRVKGALFNEGENYTVKVKVLKTASEGASKVASISYVHSSSGGRSAKQGSIKTENSAGRSGTYYFPANYNIGSHPVMVAFHGTGGEGEDMVSAFKSLADQHGFILIAPDSRKSPSGDFTWEVGTSAGEVTEDYTHTLNCMEEVLGKSNLSADLSSVLAVGYSGGGSSAPYLATNDTQFTAFAVLHGGVFTSGLGSNIVPGWFSTGSNDDQRTPSELQGYVASMQALGFSDTSFHEYSGGHSLGSNEKSDLIDWWLD